MTTTKVPKIVARPGWCTTHDDLAWRYYDGSFSCWYCCIVESTENTEGCRVVPATVTVRGKPKRFKRWTP